MINSWTEEDVEAILVQLNKQKLPFARYEISLLGSGMLLLGTGASARVYEAEIRGKKRKRAAIKVIGFDNKHVDSESFRSSVAAQKEIGRHNYGNVIEIYDSVELCVTVEGEHTVVDAVKIKEHDEVTFGGNRLHLQFIVMELISPVIFSKNGKTRLLVDKLSDGDEKEILRLAEDIGSALYWAHKLNIMHRDVKLENIFYDFRTKHYKLGDFGIARTTDDGMASTVAFTKGYGAPEVVGTIDDKYDYTADIYSLGMLLYLLLNGLRFPGSAGYRCNIYQYMQGYAAPKPSGGSDAFVEIVLKMIQFNPDDRYQTMEEVVNSFDGIVYGHRLKYRMEHANASLSVGAGLMMVGIVLWDMSNPYASKTVYSIWMLLLFGLCIIKALIKLRGKDTLGISLLILLDSIPILLNAHFSRKAIVLILGALFCGIVPGIASAGNLLAYAVQELSRYSVSSIGFGPLDRWLPALCILLSMPLLFLNFQLGLRNKKAIKSYWVWISSIIGFMDCITLGVLGERDILVLAKFLARITGMNYMQSAAWAIEIRMLNPIRIGIFGLAFCIFWIAREYFMIYYERNRVRKLIDKMK